MNSAELLVPAVRWDAQHGFEQQGRLIAQALEMGVGGFIIFGGAAGEVARLTAGLHARSPQPLLIGADLERGAGQQFSGSTGLPPLAALGWLGDDAVMRTAGALTAAEARQLGINWVYGPVLDLDLEPENPIVGTRAIGAEPRTVASLGRAWIEGCQSLGVLACAKHFPGHGRTTSDSHAELPIVTASREELEMTDLLPFAEAARAGVASVMTAHVAYPALDQNGGPATLSPGILQSLLRDRLGFDGLVVTDALIMAGVLQGQSAGNASVLALAAGCDMLLYPSDLTAVSNAVREAADQGKLDRGRLQASAERRRRWATWAKVGSSSASTASGVPADASAWAADVACRVVHGVRGEPPPLVGDAQLTIVDDDIGGPYPPPSREPFRERLRELGLAIREDDARGAASAHIIALFGDIRAWKGRPGYSADALLQVRSAIAAAGPGARPVIVQFSHPRLASAIDGGAALVCAWGGEETMQRAAADWLMRRCGSN